MSYYTTCPKCGASLDPGEKCDCGQAKATKRSLLERISKIEVDPRYCIQLSEAMEIADDSGGICEAIYRAFTYGYLKGQRAERKKRK